MILIYYYNDYLLKIYLILNSHYIVDCVDKLDTNTYYYLGMYDNKYFIILHNTNIIYEKTYNTFEEVLYDNKIKHLKLFTLCFYC